nr:MAK10-like protein [Tanacetum cinerariifolium]
NAKESWSLLEDIALYENKTWYEPRDFTTPVKAIFTPQSTSKTPDRRLLELEDQINFLLKGSRSTPRPSSTHIPQAYAEAVYSNPCSQNQIRPPKQNPFTFHERTDPNPQPQALGTTFKARVRDYIPVHTERIERFDNAIFKQREEINDRMAEIGEEERNDNDDMAADDSINGTYTKMSIQEGENETEAKNGTKNKPIKRVEREEIAKAYSSQPIGYYLKHRINKQLIEGLVDNHRFNDSLSRIQVGKVKGKTYNLLPRGPV